MKKLDYPVSFDVMNMFGKYVPVLPTEDLRVGDDLTEEMKRQPGLFAYYAALAEEEAHRVKKLRYQIHCLSEDLDKKFRDQQVGRVRPTERALAIRIKSHPRMRELYERLVKAQRRAGHLKVLREAFEQRKDMLQSIGANRRREAEEGDLRTLQRRATDKLRLINNK